MLVYVRISSQLINLVPLQGLQRIQQTKQIKGTEKTVLFSDAHHVPYNCNSEFNVAVIG